MSTNDSHTQISPQRARFIKKYSSVLIAFGEFIDGYDLTVIGVAMVFLVPYFHLSPAATGGMVAISFVGTAIGLLVFGDLADRIGRKKVFAINLWVFIISALLSALVNQVWLLWVCRFLIGVAVGMDIPTSAAFLAEVSPKARRGRIAGSLPNLTWVAGAIVSILLALALSPIFGNSTWRIMFAFAAVPSAIVLYLRHFLPESPRWLMAHGRVEEAKEVFAALDLTEEAMAIPPKQTARQFSRLLKGDSLRRMLTVSAFFMCNTFAGPVVTFLGPIVLEKAGIDVKHNLLISLAANTIGLVSILIGAVIIDRINRRTLGLLTAAVLCGASLSLGLLGAHSTVILVVCFLIWTFTTWLGPAVLAWVWTAEAYPTELRGFGSGFTQSLARLVSAITATFIPVVVQAHGLVALAPFCIAYLLMFLVILANPWLASTGESLETTAAE